MTIEGLSEITTTVCPNEWKAKESKDININSILEDAMAISSECDEHEVAVLERCDELDQLSAPLLCYNYSLLCGRNVKKHDGVMRLILM